jgi:hypothetical protein
MPTEKNERFRSRQLNLSTSDQTVGRRSKLIQVDTRGNDMY